jgi:hypothetical protein
MRLIAILVFAAAAATAREPGIGEPQRDVNVCMALGDTSAEALPAQAMVSQIYAAIGLTIHWHTARPCPWSDAILISVCSQTPPDEHPGELAWARPFEGIHIMVFYDRIKPMEKPVFPFRVLGYVLAHEIAHILQGTNTHSETGIMRARWEVRERLLMEANRLRFTPADVESLYAGFDGRPGRLRPALAATAPVYHNIMKTHRRTQR